MKPFIPHQILTGTTWHARHMPAKHSFSYPYRYWGLSLKRLANGDFPPDSHGDKLKIVGKLFSTHKRALHNFDFADYFDINKLDESNVDNAKYLKQSLEFSDTLHKWDNKQGINQEANQEKAKHWLDTVNQEFIRLTGSQPTGDILALVVSRNLGVYFSPVNFYIGFDKAGNASHLLAEVSNTPWNKRHFYGFLLTGNDSEFSHNKDFHVSPFNPLDQTYTWKVKVSAPKESYLKNIKLSIHVSDERGKVFEAGINMKSMPMTSQNLRHTIKQNPVMNYSSMVRIYWHAFRLYVMKKVPYVGYNQKLKESGQATFKK
ncbi:DUF1365 domain-containing protein [Psychrobacter sp. HD31]|uniref:DUF1365 domain-containing protein n=1 Tax=Psychrobacter sp. HD31 TaxID=3112003 RepID=UPI003DA3BF96